MNKDDFEEIEFFEVPPYNVTLVFKAVMVLLQLPPSWDNAKTLIADFDFLERVRKASCFLLITINTLDFSLILIFLMIVKTCMFFVFLTTD